MFKTIYENKISWQLNYKQCNTFKFIVNLCKSCAYARHPDKLTVNKTTSLWMRCSIFWELKLNFIYIIETTSMLVRKHNRCQYMYWQSTHWSQSKIEFVQLLAWGTLVCHTNNTHGVKTRSWAILYIYKKTVVTNCTCSLQTCTENEIIK